MADFQSHYVIVHVKALAYRKISLTHDAHTQMLIETDGRIVPVDIQLDSGRKLRSVLTHKIDCGLEKYSAEPLALFGRKHVYLLEMEQRHYCFIFRIGGVWILMRRAGLLHRRILLLYGNISARPLPVVCDMIHMSLLELPSEIRQ